METQTLTSPNVLSADHAPAAQTARRIESIDVVRGIIMILMALDHTRDFFGVRTDPTNLTTTTVALFFTRWITHFCAPTFFLLTGVGSALSLSKGTTRELSRFLLTRGIWLVVLEVAVLRCLGFQFNFDYRVTALTVLWALGWSMIALSALAHLPTKVVATIGLALIVGHNAFDFVQSANPLWIVLHRPGFLVRTQEHIVFVAYPLIPWIGVTAVGFALGRIYSWDAERRRAFLLRLGIALPIAFVVLRALNVYGDPVRWAQQPSASFTVVSFLNTTKYPPSLLFLLMTLGVTLLGLRVFGGDGGGGGVSRVFQPALRFGKVPLFFFLLHLPLIHVLAMGVSFVRYGSVHWFFESPSLDRYPFTLPPGWGYSLPAVYGFWILVLVLMYPLCSWFAAVKARHRAVWLRYL
jgi:uncharacterized membrane protein